MQHFELTRHVSRRLSAGRRLGTPSPTEELSLSVLLHPKDDRVLRDTARSVSDPGSSSYGKFLTAEEVRRLIAPGYQDLDAVAAWLHNAGLQTDEPTGARTVIKARGTIDAISRAFQLSIGRYGFPPGMMPPVRGGRLAAEQNPKIPAALAPIVRGIAGLNDLPAARLFPPIMAPRRSRVPRRGPSDARGPGGGFTPEAIRSAYAIPDPRSSSQGGAGERIAILEFGGGFAPAEFALYCKTYALPSGDLGEISVSGARNDFQGKAAEADVEVALDMDWVRATAPHAAIDLYWTPNVDRGWVDFLSLLLDLPEEKRPTIVSISWGMPEDGFSTSRRYDQTRQLFLSGALLGITFVSASGDAGASDEIPGTPFFDRQRHVDFPSMVPEVTSVGGTRLLPAPRGFTEVAWNDGDGRGAGGGGFSRFVAVPEWQKKSIGKRTGVTGRGIPDVAAVASADPGLSIFVHKSWTAAGGTSVAAPIWAGVLAQVNAARRSAGQPRLGAANAALYAASAGRSSPYNDILKGDNSYAGVEGFAATKGWDPATGLGSPDSSKLVKALGRSGSPDSKMRKPT